MVSQPKLVSAGCHQCLLQDFTGAVDRHAAHQTSGTVFFFIFSNVDRSSGDETSGVGGDVTAPPVCLCLLSGPAPSSCSSSLLSEPRPAPVAEPRRSTEEVSGWHRMLMTSLPVYINNIALVWSAASLCDRWILTGGRWENWHLHVRCKITPPSGEHFYAFEQLLCSLIWPQPVWIPAIGWIIYAQNEFVWQSICFAFGKMQFDIHTCC